MRKWAKKLKKIANMAFFYGALRAKMVAFAYSITTENQMTFGLKNPSAFWAVESHV